MKLPYREVFNASGDREVLLGIYGRFIVRVVLDDANNRHLSVERSDRADAWVSDQDRAKVFETLLLALIEREEEDHRK